MKDLRFSQQCGNLYLELSDPADRATMILQNPRSYLPSDTGYKAWPFITG
jgi:hypothetical protein